MRGARRIAERIEQDTVTPVRRMADQAFSRAAGAPLVPGNHVTLLKDAAENYPAWLAAIAAARKTVHFECYIIHEDDTGRQFAGALIEKARQGVKVRLLYDWMGALGKTSRGFWKRLRRGGVEVRCYNPPSLFSPLGWLSRDHRKMLAVDGEVGFVTGLCVGRMWVGDPKRKIEPWRDTGVEVRGPAVLDIERAFAQVWARTGAVLPEETGRQESPAPAGDISLRVVASVPNTAGMFRLDQLVAALARERLWLTDAYFAGTTPYVQALRAAALDGVDVRLLVPNATDIPVLRPLSRAGFKPLMQAGVRIFEWNGPMVHAKTAVADGRWARVGSTNLNIASWLGNCELDVAVENENFARQMEDMYLEDLEHATELVLDTRAKLRAPGAPRKRRRGRIGSRGSAGRAATGVLRIGNAVGAAMAGQRALGPVEASLMTTAGGLLLAVAAATFIFPRVLAYPVAVALGWMGIVALARGVAMYRRRS
ncbi:MAG TPA: phospholipase D-like domain-containing protein [Bryobacteraceae bacterium]|jgi:cardiolipin synthase